jgi:hypothetical protein
MPEITKDIKINRCWVYCKIKVILCNLQLVEEMWFIGLNLVMVLMRITKLSLAKNRL